jgi:membrane-associated protease RseP (regulator of RpoE activity)
MRKMDSHPIAGESNVSRLQAELSGVLSVSDVQVLEAPDRVVSFNGHLLRDAESAYAALRERFLALGYTPFLRRQGNYEMVVAQQGVILPRPAQVWINVALFAATLLATLLTGAVNEVGQKVPTAAMILPAMLRQPALLLTGLPFALTLMSILLAHEMGHYIVGRRYNAPVSLPYFIPMPIVGLFGTMGAVIVQRAPFEDRRSLFDIGVAGPLAGLVVALPLLVFGLSTSPVGPIQPGGLLEGNSILYLVIKYAIFGQILPGNGMDVYLNPVAWAAWGGLLVTSLNLLPIGQLDGGHILYSLLGKRAWPVAMGMVALLVVMGYFWQGWLVWAFLVFIFGVRHPAPLNDLTPLGPRRTLVGLGVLVLFVLTFTPIPFSAVL